MRDILDCNIVQDILPNYVEKLTNGQTNIAVKKHLENCSKCNTIYENMKRNIVVENQMEIKELKDGLNKTKRIYLIKGILSTILVLSIFISFIVNLAVSHYLSWFYIVTCSVILVGIFIGILMFKEENKLSCAMASLSILILPFLVVIEKVINRFFLDTPVLWVKEYALPITIIWMVVIWIGVFALRKSKVNSAFCLTIMFILAIPASIMTNQLVNGNKAENILKENWIGILCCGVLAILSLIVGILIKLNKDNSAL